MPAKNAAPRKAKINKARALEPATAVLEATLAALSEKDAALELRDQELMQLNSWFELALNNMARGLSMFDNQQRLIVCNKAYQEIYDLPDRLTKRGTALSEITRFHVLREKGKEGPKDRARQRTWIKRHVAEIRAGNTFTETHHLKNGRIVLVTIKPLADGGWVDVQEDITERRKAEQQIHWLARHDPLTEVANRIAFHEALDVALANLRKTDGFAIHWIDLDHFKQINDTLGHPIGDALLKSVARRLQHCVRDNDLVARLGGDEFVIIQSGAEDWSAAQQLAGRILSEIARPHHVLGRQVDCTATIGIVLSPQHGRLADDLMKGADIALYRAKAAGRNAFEFFEPGNDRTVSDRNRLADDLEQAFEKRQLELHYQPIVDSKARAVVAFEALMRWTHSERGSISPSEFIPVAEQTGLIVEIGAWAIRRACHDAASWPSNVGVTVNLSPVQFERGNIHQAVVAALVSSGLDPRRLELEITEGVLLRDEAATSQALHNLRALGVRIALDDFGTAYASLSYLRQFPFDKIKIDRSFVKDLDPVRRSDCLAIITAVSSLARHLQMRTVVEGVETREQVETVLGAGCDELQGFYFSRAVPADSIRGVIQECAERFASERKSTPRRRRA